LYAVIPQDGEDRGASPTRERHATGVVQIGTPLACLVVFLRSKSLGTLELPLPNRRTIVDKNPVSAGFLRGIQRLVGERHQVLRRGRSGGGPTRNAEGRVDREVLVFPADARGLNLPAKMSLNACSTRPNESELVMGRRHASPHSALVASA